MLNGCYFYSHLEVKKSQGKSSQIQHPWNDLCSFAHDIYWVGNKLAYLLLWFPTWLHIIPCVPNPFPQTGLLSPRRDFSILWRVTWELETQVTESLLWRDISGTPHRCLPNQHWLVWLKQSDLSTICTGGKKYHLFSTHSGLRTVCCFFFGGVLFGLRSVIGV